MTRPELLSVDGTTISVARVGAIGSSMSLIWGHGWGQSGGALLPMAESLGAFAGSAVLDFPGFGGSPPPPTTWGTEEFADHVAKWLASTPPACRIWIGHSFGCRVGLQIAARHPGLLSGLVLIAAAGLRPKRSVRLQTYYLLRRNLFRLTRVVVGEGSLLEFMRSRLGSSDYKAAGEMRPILSRVVSEDLSEVARAVTCPTLLIYGEQDKDTPPEIGQRLQQLIYNSSLMILDDFDHHSILLDGRHQVVRHIKAFAEETCKCLS